MTPALRADVALVQAGLFDSRAKAREAIEAGLVTADGVPVTKPAAMLAGTAVLAATPAYPWVSRGGVKLAAALDRFGFAPDGRVCLDIGASTGGFSQVLLHGGAAHVIALDVGRAQLHPLLLNEPRLTLLEGRDARSLEADDLPEAPTLLTFDVSFISLRLVLSHVLSFAAPTAELVALVKPQFEAGRHRVNKGVVRDPAIHVEVCATLRETVEGLGWRVLDVVPSPIEGQDGNREFLLGARRPASRPLVLDILKLGQRGEGVAAGPVYLPDALPGERVEADVEGDRGRVLAVLDASPDRIEPICPYFGACGGCAIQSLAPPPYAEWKRALVVTALSMAGVEAGVEPLVAAHGAGRRRATFHARAQKSVNVLVERPPVVGFMQARAHEIVAIAFCPILAPDLGGALAAARAVAEALAPSGKPLDILVTATRNGLDVDVRGCGPLDEPLTQAAIAAAVARDCARLSNHGSVLVERRAPLLRMGTAEVVLPPGAFLQATERGEEILAGEVLAGVGSARRVLDLFGGVGTFALRLAAGATVHVVDQEAAPLAALTKAARAQPALRPVTAETRDLFRRPFTAPELARFDAVVFDPPRAGAEKQAEQLAASTVPTVLAVSCSPASFARDAAILIKGGYRLERVVPVDQFLYSSHVELVAVFKRPAARGKRRGMLS